MVPSTRRAGLWGWGDVALGVLLLVIDDRRRARAGGVVADAAREREVAADLGALVPVLAEAK